MAKLEARRKVYVAIADLVAETNKQVRDAAGEALDDNDPFLINSLRRIDAQPEHYCAAARRAEGGWVYCCQEEAEAIVIMDPDQPSEEGDDYDATNDGMLFNLDDPLAIEKAAEWCDDYASLYMDGDEEDDLAEQLDDLEEEDDEWNT
jgi:hypothetical protein